MKNYGGWPVRSGRSLIQAVRGRLARQLASRGHPPEYVAEAANVLDPNTLTLGFARRFTGYKRPNLLLADPPRLARLLNDPARPVQLVLAGKAHPADEEGKELIREWIELAQRPEFRRHVVFLEDYDIALAQELVQGVDVWVNTPRRPWEACGTSGMKVLVNGGLNLSERDGWWEEAYAPELGWAIDGGEEVRGALRKRARRARRRSPLFHPRTRGGCGILRSRCGGIAAALASAHAAEHGDAGADLQQQSDGARLCRAILSRRCGRVSPPYGRPGTSRREPCEVGSFACGSIGRDFTSVSPPYRETIELGISRCRSILPTFRRKMWRFSFMRICTQPRRRL